MIPYKKLNVIFILKRNNYFPYNVCLSKKIICNNEKSKQQKFLRLKYLNFKNFNINKNS